MAKHDVMAADDLGMESHEVVDAGGKEILVARTKLGLFAVQAECSHQQQPLKGGKQKACFLFCPHHGVRFDLRDGAPTGNLTDRHLKRYEVAEENGRIWVDDEALD